MGNLPPLRDYSRSLAMLVGTWEYTFLEPIPAAEHSLRRMEGLLTGQLCGWPHDRVLTLENVPDPGSLPDRLITALEDVRDVALFYFVGHGQISPGDHLCLGLTRSRPEPNRRAATSLRFADVRQALQESDAAVKILILDCCFAGLATQPHQATMAGMVPDVLELTTGTGAYTMAATGADTTAWYEDDPGLDSPQTYFTKYLADLVEEGIPGQPARLQLDPLFRRLSDKLTTDARPAPRRRAVDDARQFVFSYNAAPPTTHRDLDAEVKSLTRQLADAERRLAEADIRFAEAQRRLAREHDDAIAREQALHAQMSEFDQERGQPNNLPEGSSRSQEYRTASQPRSATAGGTSFEEAQAEIMARLRIAEAETEEAKRRLEETKAERLSARAHQQVYFPNLVDQRADELLLSDAQARADEAEQRLEDTERRLSQERGHPHRPNLVGRTDELLATKAKVPSEIISLDTGQSAEVPGFPGRKFPASGTRFTAKRAAALAQAWRWRVISSFLLSPAILIALLNLLHVAAGFGWQGGAAWLGMLIAECVLAALAVAGFAIASILFRKEWKWPPPGMMTILCLIAASAILRSFSVGGWLAWALLVILFISGAYAFRAVLFLDAPDKRMYVVDLELAPSGMTFTFGDGARRNIPWSILRSITSANYTVTAQISPSDHESVDPSWRLYYESTGQVLRLFYWNDYPDPNQILDAIEAYSREPVTRRPGPRHARTSRHPDHRLQHLGLG